MYLSRRLLVLFAVIAAVAAGGAWAYRHEPEIRAQARDYLAYRRITRHREAIAVASRESGVDPYLLSAIMHSESSGRVGVVSNKGALGLFQLSETTAKWRAEIMGLPEPTNEQLLSDPLLNARLGANNVAWLLRTYDGDELRALCAYNAGTRRLKILSQEAGGWEAWRARGEASGRSEILEYGKKVLHYRDRFRERGLFDDPLDPSGPNESVPSGAEGNSVEAKDDEPSQRGEPSAG